MKKFFLGMMLSFLFAAAGAQKLQQRDISIDYLQQNVAMTKIAARAITTTTYAAEITLTDFSRTSPLPTGFGFQGLVYADDGLGYDKIRGDGLYTAKSLSKFVNGYAKTKELNKIVYDESFSFKEQIENIESRSSTIGIKCKFKKCGCPCSDGGTCPACTWWGWSCWELVDCEVGLDF